MNEQKPKTVGDPIDASYWEPGDAICHVHEHPGIEEWLDKTNDHLERIGNVLRHILHQMPNS